MARLPTAQENTAIAAIFVPTTTYYTGLNTGDPGTTGASEVSGGSYGRQVTQFGAASGGQEVTTDSQVFTGMPSATVPYFSLWSAITSGTYLGGGQLTSSLTVPTGATVSFAIGATSVGIS